MLLSPDENLEYDRLPANTIGYIQVVCVSITLPARTDAGQHRVAICVETTVNRLSTHTLTAQHAGLTVSPPRTHSLPFCGVPRTQAQPRTEVADYVSLVASPCVWTCCASSCCFPCAHTIYFACVYALVCAGHRGREGRKQASSSGTGPKGLDVVPCACVLSVRSQ